MFIDPSKTPLIDNKDPRWLGAWWFGWMILGTLMCLFSGLIGLFPKELPKKNNRRLYNSHLPQVLRHQELQEEEGLPLGRSFSSNAALDAPPPSTSQLPTMKGKFVAFVFSFFYSLNMILNSIIKAVLKKNSCLVLFFVAVKEAN